MVKHNSNICVTKIQRGRPHIPRPWELGEGLYCLMQSNTLQVDQSRNSFCKSWYFWYVFFQFRGRCWEEGSLLRLPRHCWENELRQKRDYEETKIGHFFYLPTFLEIFSLISLAYLNHVSVSAIKCTNSHIQIFLQLLKFNFTPSKGLSHLL